MALTRFDWDPVKDLENQRKHGVSFAKAQYAFADSSRVIAEDLGHSEDVEMLEIVMPGKFKTEEVGSV